MPVLRYDICPRKLCPLLSMKLFYTSGVGSRFHSATAAGSNFTKTTTIYLCKHIRCILSFARFLAIPLSLSLFFFCYPYTHWPIHPSPMCHWYVSPMNNVISFLSWSFLHKSQVAILIFFFIYTKFGSSVFVYRWNVFAFCSYMCFENACQWAVRALIFLFFDCTFIERGNANL